MQQMEQFLPGQQFQSALKRLLMMQLTKMLITNMNMIHIYMTRKIKKSMLKQKLSCRKIKTLN